MVAVLGTVMVLAGTTLIVLRTLGRLNATSPDSDATPTAPPRPGTPATGRWLSRRRLSPATQLIGWGVVLLVVAAFTVGLISFGVNLEAGTQ